MEFTTYRLGNGLSLSPVHMQLDQFARETLDEIETVSRGRTLRLECHGDMTVEWDQRRVHQALSNLVFNALKYGFADSPIVVSIERPPATAATRPRPSSTHPIRTRSPGRTGRATSRCRPGCGRP